MIETFATVIAVDSTHAWVKADTKKGCGSCSKAGGCSSLFFEFMTPSKQLLKVVKPFELTSGQEVVIGLTERWLLLSAFMLYGLPLVGFLLGALVGQGTQQWWQLTGDAGPIVGAIVGLTIALVTLKLTSKKHHSKGGPRILRLHDDAEHTLHFVKHS